MIKNKLRFTLYILLVLIISSILNYFIFTFFTIDSILLIIFLSTLFTSIMATVILRREFYSCDTVNEQLKETLKVRDAILELAQAINISSEQELYDLIISVAVDVIKNADMGSIILINEDNTLQYKSAVYFNLQELQNNVNLKLEESYIYLAGNGNINNTVIINNAVDFNKKHQTEGSKGLMHTKGIDEIKSTLSSPIIIDNKLIGMINIDSRTPYAFNEDDIKLVHFFTYEAAKLIQLFNTLARNTYLSRYDSLTNIYNRRFFNDALKKLLDELGPDDIFSLISIDLNNLKVTNDTYGHDIGDKLIMSFVNIINNYLSDKDIFSRYGGDEFIIVLYNKNINEAEKLISDSNKAMSLINIGCGSNKIYPTYSWGIVEYPKDGKDYKELIKLADNYMYENKRNQQKETI